MIVLALLLAQLLFPPSPFNSPIRISPASPESVQPGSGSRAPFINVRAAPYFATGDGSTDDSAAIQAAITSLGASGGTLIFPPSTGAYVTTIPGLGTVQPGSIIVGAGTPDARLYVHRIIQPTQPAPQNPTGFPLGNDLYMSASGPADIHVANLQLDLTSTTSVGAPGSATVTTGSTAALCPPVSTCSIIIEPGSAANTETITSANWSIASGTSVTATFAKAHTQPFTIRQVGALFFDLGQMAKFSLLMPTSTVSTYNTSAAEIFRIEQQSNGAGSIRLFSQAGAQNGRLAVNGSGINFYSLAGTGSGGINFYGQASGQRPLYTFFDNETDLNTAFLVNTNTKQVQIGGVTFANLGTPGAGTMSYCSDCTIANPCASGGTGAIAKRLNGAWICN